MVYKKLIQTQKKIVVQIINKLITGDIWNVEKNTY